MLGTLWLTKGLLEVIVPVGLLAVSFYLLKALVTPHSKRGGVGPGAGTSSPAPGSPASSSKGRPPRTSPATSSASPASSSMPGGGFRFDLGALAAPLAAVWGAGEGGSGGGGDDADLLQAEVREPSTPLQHA